MEITWSEGEDNESSDYTEINLDHSDYEEVDSMDDEVSISSSSSGADFYCQANNVTQ